MARAMQPAGRDAWLDGLRALAALMVFAHHASTTYVGGWDAGVLIFFSLSGYLLYRPFLESEVDVRTYAIRRVARIFPAYLVATVVIATMLSYPLDVLDVIQMNASVIAVVWTLKIELLFYLALPVVAWVARGHRDVLLILAAVSFLWAGFEMLGRPVIPIDFPAWAWAFVPGMLVAHLAVRNPAVLARARTPLVPLAGVVLVAMSVIPDIRFPDVPAVIGSALILAWLLGLPAPRPRVATAMAAGAALSYSFYLWHEAVLDAVGRTSGLVGVVVALLLTCAIAAGVYLVVERPGIALGRRVAALDVPRFRRRVALPALPELVPPAEDATVPSGGHPAG